MAEAQQTKLKRYGPTVDEKRRLLLAYHEGDDWLLRSATWYNNFVGKNVVIVFDNAPAHSQTEERVVMHDDLVFLRLGPYSPMFNPIENCFIVFKAKIKNFLADRTGLMF
ncbi:hypothetical protein DYB32_008887 [Aphanomyces invadans]|uniref:Tc1-like transposase DDE domain-containing protein n=1 Tax=Aphanomyces invadans TaxID=157072 RepID=A0A418AJY1_9STRA|nr:hypothetical protein DYB32_008887 [Aphanomyces invadans]